MYYGFMYNTQGILIEQFANYGSNISSPSSAITKPIQQVCGEKFPVINKNGSTTYPKCDPGYFCLDGSCKTFDERLDYQNFDANTCTYSGKGINPGQNGETCSFLITRSDACGPKNDYAQCSTGMFCNNDGKCGFENSYATPGTNCDLYSGEGIKNCKRKETTNNKCGPKNGYRKCLPGQFCNTDGFCSTNTQDNSVNCIIYSGDGTLNCRTIPTPGITIQNQSNLVNNSSQEVTNTNASITPEGDLTRGITTDKRCGINNKKCPSYQYCNDNGKCDYKPSINKKKYCATYSGFGINDCSSVVSIQDNKIFNKDIPGNVYNTATVDALNFDDCVGQLITSNKWKSFMYDDKKCMMSTIPGSMAKARQKNKKGSLYGYFNK